MDLFKIDGEINKKTSLIIMFGGFVFLTMFWYIITVFGGISSTLLPSPIEVIKSFKILLLKNDLLSNMWYSISLNFYGYLEAICIAIPLGFIIGLFPFFRSLLSGYVNAIRFLPLTAVTGIFIAWFGIEIMMKVHFLAFGIIIYLLPVVVQRIDEIEKVHKQTIYTLNATQLQQFIHVYFPSVMSRISDDIRVMVAISWTYIIVAELINTSQGLGAMIYTASKQSHMDRVFAILIIIIIIGFLQDILFKQLDKCLFEHKYK
jgi:NitT/TauT family transport system permease protein